MLAWALWDCGATGLSAIVVTFVFSIYLTGRVGEGMPGGTPPASWLGRALTVAGFTIALLAPVIGVWVEAPRRRRLALGTLTGLAVTFTASMSLIREQPGYLWPGLVLLAATAACGDLASVPYNAMLRQLSTTRTSAGFPASAGRGLRRQRGAAAHRLRRVYFRIWQPSRIAAAVQPRRLERAGRHAADGRLAVDVRDAAAARRTPAAGVSARVAPRERLADRLPQAVV
ncbi:transporter, MFS superfamily [Mycobacterium xenopi 3993]|nr:transporter, MFS superfamily [Mycobacterium xenopi 3993]